VGTTRQYPSNKEVLMGGRLEGKRIAFLTANEGVEQAELEQPWEALINVGAPLAV
jgi:hypothetical protein